MPKKNYTESIMPTTKETCYICGCNQGNERHHVFSGHPNRKRSEADGVWVWLCRTCHQGIHDHNTGESELKRKAQEVWMRTYRKTIEDFIGRYGKSYM